MKLAILVISCAALLCAGGDWMLFPSPYSRALPVVVPLAVAASSLSSVAAYRRGREGLSAGLFVLPLFGMLALLCGVVLAAVRFGFVPIGGQPLPPSPARAAQIRFWILTPLFALPLAALGSLLALGPKPAALADE